MVMVYHEDHRAHREELKISVLSVFSVVKN